MIELDWDEWAYAWITIEATVRPFPSKFLSLHKSSYEDFLYFVVRLNDKDPDALALWPILLAEKLKS